MPTVQSRKLRAGYFETRSSVCCRSLSEKESKLKSRMQRLGREQERGERAATANRVTPKQLEFIHDLGGTCVDNVTKQQASEIIDCLLTSRPTVRQRMALRFWNRLDLLTTGVEGVSAWMDRWYEADLHRLEAWELWKQESGDNGGRSPASIDSVALGAGEEYLVRVKATRRD